MTEVEIVRIPVAPSNMERLVAAFVEGRAGYLAPPSVERMRAIYVESLG